MPADRAKPFSNEAEQAVLGSILIDSRCVAEVIGVVSPEDFYLQQNREIYPPNIIWGNVSNMAMVLPKTFVQQPDGTLWLPIKVI